MARIIYSALVNQINGSIAGTTFQRNAYGNTIKSKPNMVTPNRLLQIESQLEFTKTAQNWRTITQLQRDEWAAYASAFPRPSRLNPASYLNGFNYFGACNNLSTKAPGSPLIASPSGAQGTATLNLVELRRIGATFNVELGLTVTGTNWVWYLYLTSVVGVGQEYVAQTPKFIESRALTANFVRDITTEYNAVFGRIPVTGEWIGYRVVFQKVNNGQIFDFGVGQAQVL